MFRKLVTLCLLLAAGGRSLAATDLLEAYRDAVTTNPELLRTVADTAAAQEVKPQARALLLPDLRAGASFNRFYDYKDDRFPDETGRSSFEGRSYQLTLTQPLYNREAWYRTQQANATAGRADTGLVAARQQLIFDVAQAYLGVLAALDTLTSVIANKNAVARELEQAKQRFEVGLVTITDVYDAQARYDSAVSEEISARNDVGNTNEALRRVTGKTYEALNVLDPKVPLDPVDPNDPEAWVKIALAENSLIKGAQLGVESARENIEVQKSGHYPTVDLKADRVFQNQDTNETSGYQVGVAVAVPLFQGGAVNSRTREAAYQHEGAKQNLEDVQRGVVLQIRDAYRGLESARSLVRALEQAVIANRSSVEANHAGYEVGTRTIVDVLNAQRSLYLSERNLAIARYDYIVNRLTLLLAAGRISEDNLAALNRWLRLPGTVPAFHAAPTATPAVPARQPPPGAVPAPVPTPAPAPADAGAGRKNGRSGSGRSHSQPK